MKNGINKINQYFKAQESLASGYALLAPLKGQNAAALCKKYARMHVMLAPKNAERKTEHCKECAEACRACAEECRKMAA